VGVSLLVVAREIGGDDVELAWRAVLPAGAEGLGEQVLTFEGVDERVERLAATRCCDRRLRHDVVRARKRCKGSAARALSPDLASCALGGHAPQK